MGNSASTSSADEERAFIHQLGERFPLGDAELRKWTWVVEKTQGSNSTVSLATLAAWSSAYGDCREFDRDPPSTRKDQSERVFKTTSLVEQNIFTDRLSDVIIRVALRVSLEGEQGGPASYQHDLNSATSLATEGEQWYSIQSTIKKCSSSFCENHRGSLDSFLEGLSVSHGRRGTRSSLRLLFKIASCYSDGKGAKATRLVQISYQLTLAASFLRSIALNEMHQMNQSSGPNQERELKSMTDSLLTFAKDQRQRTHYSSGGNDTDVSLDEFTDWAETNVPLIASAMPTFIHVLFHFFSRRKNDGEDDPPCFPPGVTPIWLPRVTTVDRTQSDSRNAPTSILVDDASKFALACTSMNIASGRWHRLFTSDLNGMSINYMLSSILGYGGATLIVIRSKDSSDQGKCCTSLLGAYTGVPWVERPAFYGNSSAFLFRLGPDPMSVCRPKGGGEKNFMYFNREARSKGYDGLAHGLGLGGSPESPRLFLDEGLDSCRASDSDLTFEKGALLSGAHENSSHFEVECMEVFGVGTWREVSEGLLARANVREEKEKEIRKAMKGAKGQFLEDMKSGVMGTKVFAHREQMRGRDGDCSLECEEDAEPS